MKRRILGAFLLSLMLCFSGVHSVELIDFMGRYSGNLTRMRTLFSFAKWNQGGAAVQDILLKRLEKYTIFAPTDYAFNVFGKVGFLQEKGREELFTKFIKAHILKGVVRRKQMKSQTRPFRTEAGSKVRLWVDYKQKVFYVYARRDASVNERAKILYSVETDNGMVHVIDKVLVFNQLKDNLDVVSKIRVR